MPSADVVSNDATDMVVYSPDSPCMDSSLAQIETGRVSPQDKRQDLSQDVMSPSLLKTFGENSIDNLKENDSFQNETNDLQGLSKSSVSTPQRTQIVDQAARTRVYLRRKTSLSTTIGEMVRGKGSENTCQRTLFSEDLDTNKIATNRLASSSDALPMDSMTQINSSVLAEEIDNHNTIKEMSPAVPSPYFDAQQDPAQATDNTQALSSTSVTNYNDFEENQNTTMVLDASDLNLEGILDGCCDELGVTLDLMPIMVEPEETTANLEGDHEEATQENLEFIQDSPLNVVREEVRPKQLTRKRARNPSQHKAAEAKRALYAGEAHVNKKGEFRPAPKMRPPCVCKYKCSTKVTEEEREESFRVYNCTLGCKDKQWAYIRAHSSSNPVTKSTTPHDTPQRKVSRKYFLDKKKGKWRNGECPSL